MVEMVAAALMLTLGQTEPDFLRAQPPTSLTDATFAEVRRHATPTSADLAFQSMDWRSTIYDGLRAAQAEDKPLLMWMYFGDPRGHC